MKNNQILLFLQETLQRLFTKSPKFFKIWTLVFSILTLITGIPELLTYLGVVLPTEIAFFASKFIAYVSMGCLLMSKLTTQSKPTGVTDEGVLLKKTDDVALPFTTQAEVKANKKELPVLK